MTSISGSRMAYLAKLQQTFFLQPHDFRDMFKILPAMDTYKAWCHKSLLTQSKHVEVAGVFKWWPIFPWDLIQWKEIEGVACFFHISKMLWHISQQQFRVGHLVILILSSTLHQSNITLINSPHGFFWQLQNIYNSQGIALKLPWHNTLA